MPQFQGRQTPTMTCRSRELPPTSHRNLVAPFLYRGSQGIVPKFKGGRPPSEYTRSNFLWIHPRRSELSTEFLRGIRIDCTVVRNGWMAQLDAAHRCVRYMSTTHSLGHSSIGSSCQTDKSLFPEASIRSHLFHRTKN